MVFLRVGAAPAKAVKKVIAHAPKLGQAVFQMLFTFSANA
jgi:hypothetical protein